MAVPGTKPKPDTQKVTKHALTHDWTEVPDVRYDGERPKLPPVPKVTKDWWEDISTMPHCILWSPQQWRFAIDTARVHAMAFGPKQRSTMIPEVRNREKQMGVTADALRDLRIRYVQPVVVEERTENGVTDFEAERRKRLLESD